MRFRSLDDISRARSCKIACKLSKKFLKGVGGRKREREEKTKD